MTRQLWIAYLAGAPVMAAWMANTVRHETEHTREVMTILNLPAGDAWRYGFFVVGSALLWPLMACMHIAISLAFRGEDA